LSSVPAESVLGFEIGAWTSTKLQTAASDNDIASRCYVCRCLDGAGQLQICVDPLPIILLAVKETRLQSLGRLVAPGVIGDHDTVEFHVAQERPGLPELPQSASQFAKAVGKRIRKILISTLQEVIRIVLEKLKVALKVAEAVAEFFRVGDRVMVAGDVGCHVLERT
jgi:hypothetical protein